MTIDFDFGTIKPIEFGVALDLGDDEPKYVSMVVDAQIKEALREMALGTKVAMDSFTTGPSDYSPGEKYTSPEYVYLDSKSELAESALALHTARNIGVDQHGLDSPDKLVAYYARFSDSSGRRLTAVHRSGQFKGILKSRLVKVASDALQIVDTPVFRLDHDFDYFVDGTGVHILRPSAFEFVHGLQKAIMGAVPKNIATLRVDIPYVDFAGLEDYAKTHPRAARYVASICSLNQAANIDKTSLRQQCAGTGVSIVHAKGVITVQPGHEIGFLEVLDRRRYQVVLIKNQPERYRAASRDKI